MSLRFHTREEGRAGKTVMGRCALAELRGGCREAVYSSEIPSAEPGGSAGWDERVLGAPGVWGRSSAVAPGEHCSKEQTLELSPCNMLLLFI